MPSTSPKAVATNPIQKPIGGTMKRLDTVAGRNPVSPQTKISGRMLDKRHKEFSKLFLKMVNTKMPSIKASIVANFTSISPVS